MPRMPRWDTCAGCGDFIGGWEALLHFDLGCDRARAEILADMTNQAAPPVGEGQLVSNLEGPA